LADVGVSIRCDSHHFCVPHTNYPCLVWLIHNGFKGERVEPRSKPTMAALREAGLLDEIIETREGLIVYPAGLNQRR
jgi:hypothetical protein